MILDDSDEAAARAELHDGWGELVLSRPDRRNALTGPMVGALRAGLAELHSEGARVVILRGEGGAFCSGLDVDAFARQPAPAWRASWASEYAAFHSELYRSPAVIVGALERFAINGGASLALACDLLVAGEGSFILVGEAALGMQAPMNVAWLRLRASEAVAAQLLFGADRIPAADLFRLGLVHRVVPDKEVVRQANELAKRLAGFPGQGLAAIKDAMRRPLPDRGDVFVAVRSGGFTTAGPSRVSL